MLYSLSYRRDSRSQILLIQLSAIKPMRWRATLAGCTVIRKHAPETAVSSYLSQSMEIAENYVGLYVPLLESNWHPILKTVTE